MTNIAKRAKDWLRHENDARLPIGHSSENLPAYPASYFAPLSNFFRDIERMFNHNPALANFSQLQMFNPKVDIASNDDEYTVTCEVPGLEEKDIKLDVSADGQLTISGEKRQESSSNRKDVYCAECSYGAFERTLTLPDDVDQENIEARFRNGVLTITCPRSESAKQSRRQIPIGAGKDMRASPAHERGVSQHSPKKAA